MPGLRGPGCPQRCGASGRDSRAIFISGYPEDLLASGQDLDGRTGFLAKPFSADELACRVREAIAREAE